MQKKQNKSPLVVMLLAMAMLLGVATAAVADDTKKAEGQLPVGAVLCDRADAALGDAEKVKAVKSISTKVKVKFINMGGAEGEMVEYLERPMKAFRKTTFEGMGEMTEGTDGKVFWETTPMGGGITIHKGSAKILKQHDYASKLMYPWRDSYASAKCLGIETVDGSECYKVELTPKEGKKEIVYYDKKTNLTRKVELKLDEPVSQQELPIELIYSDYRAVNGIQHAFRVRIKVSMMDIEWVYQSIEHNKAIPAGTFDLPPAVQKKLAG